MKKNALIIGVSGQDGAYLARLLLKKGYNIIGTSRDPMINSLKNLETLKIKNEFRVISASLNDFRSVINAILVSQPDEIYNLSGQSSVSLSFEQPVETFESISMGVLNLLEAVRMQNKDIKLYNACSSECFGNSIGKPADEETSFHPRSPYAVAKSAAFWQVVNYREAYGMYTCSGILFNHESPLRPERYVTKKIVKSARLISIGRRKKLRLGNISVYRDWGWAEDYVLAMWSMLQQPKPTDFVIATGESYSLQEFISYTFSKFGLNWKNYVEIDDSLLRPADIENSFANPSKAKDLLGWKASYNMYDVIDMMVDFELSSNSNNIV